MVTDKTRITRAGGIPVYAEDCDVTPNDDLRELIEGWRNSAERHEELHKQTGEDVSGYSSAAKAFRTAANELEKTINE